jgi:hypothetical protein
MFGRNNRQPDSSDEMRAIRDTSQREAHPYNDPRANYPTAERFREIRAEGVALAQQAEAA